MSESYHVRTRARSTILLEPPHSVTNLYLKAALCRRPSTSRRSIFEESARSLVMVFAIEVRWHCFQAINKVQRSEACSSKTCVCVCVCLRVSLLVGSHWYLAICCQWLLRSSKTWKNNVKDVLIVLLANYSTRLSVLQATEYQGDMVFGTTVLPCNVHVCRRPILAVKKIDSWLRRTKSRLCESKITDTHTHSHTHTHTHTRTFTSSYARPSYARPTKWDPSTPWGTTPKHSYQIYA